MIGYVTLGSNDIDKARAFYDALLGTIGAKQLMKFDSGFTMYGTGPAKPMVAITKPFDKQAATAGNGTMVAAAVDSRAKVDEMHAKALSLGGQEFYGAYFRDLDGNKLCAFKIGPK